MLCFIGTGGEAAREKEETAELSATWDCNFKSVLSSMPQVYVHLKKKNKTKKPPPHHQTQKSQTQKIPPTFLGNELSGFLKARSKQYSNYMISILEQRLLKRFSSNMLVGAGF